MKVPFQKPSITNLEKEYILKALSGTKLCGDGPFTKKAVSLLGEKTKIYAPLLLTTSCSHALEMAMKLLHLKNGDEVILPSFTFVSTANAVLLAGAKPVFCDIHPDTMNLDERLFASFITNRTKAVVVVHYAGVPCNMDPILHLAEKHGFAVIEDAAQAVGSYYKGKPAGEIGDFGCFSFHETKNYTMGEGGALVLKRAECLQEAEIIREKGTDRSRFIRGEVDKYTWQQGGSSYLPSDVLAAMLAAQLERFEEIYEKRMHIWLQYHAALEDMEKLGKLRRPVIPEYAKHNAHLYYLLLEDQRTRDRLLSELQRRGIQATFHYIPLHISPMGQRLGCKEGELPVTEEYAARLLRLPLFYDMDDMQLDAVIRGVKECL